MPHMDFPVNGGLAAGVFCHVDNPKPSPWCKMVLWISCFLCPILVAHLAAA